MNTIVLFQNIFKTIPTIFVFKKTFFQAKTYLILNIAPTLLIYNVYLI